MMILYVVDKDYTYRPCCVPRPPQADSSPTKPTLLDNQFDAQFQNQFSL
jgi:hypothetical protein